MKKTSYTKACAVAMAFGVGLTLTACGSGESGGSDLKVGKDGITDVTMLLPAPRGILWGHILVGEELGYFEEEGVKPVIEAQTGSGFTVQQLIAGNVDFVGASAAEAVVAYAKDPRLRVVFCGYPKNVFRITVPESSDITDVAQLKGKSIGVSEAAGGEVPIVKTAMSDAGLGENDYDILPVGAGGPTTLRSLETGRVAAYSSAFFDTSSLIAGGMKLRDITPDNVGGIPGPCLLTTKDALADKDKRAAAEGIARAWSKGLVYSQAAPEAALDIVCKEVPADCEDRPFAEVVWKELLAVSANSSDGTAPGAPPVEGFQVAADVLADSDVVKPADITAFAGSPEVLDFAKSWQTFDPEEIRAEAEANGK